MSEQGRTTGSAVIRLHGGRRRVACARRVPLLLLTLALTGCDAKPASSAAIRPQQALSDADFAALIERISEPGGYFDTDNLMSNESGYLKVIDALAQTGIEGGAYVGVGPDQNFSYIAQARPDIVFITDVRRDNMLHHLLLKALIERAPTRVEFLAGLHGRFVPDDAASWRDRSIDEIVDYIDGLRADDAGLDALYQEIAAAVRSFGVPLTAEDLAAIERFHASFVRAGLGLRFRSYGRASQPYYPTYRQLLLETDIDGDQASYLSSLEAYEVIRQLQLANKIIPVVGDLAGAHALREMGVVMREMGVELETFYTSNVEFYLWRARTFDEWEANFASMPVADDAVIIRSYFPNAGGRHPSMVPGYYSTQTLQPAATLLEGGFRRYWDAVTRGVLELRVAG